MPRLTLTCDCGQEMFVPESAVGRAGHCPACGRAIVIDPDRVRPRDGGGRLLSMRRATPRAPVAAPSEGDAGWRQFAEAVDLYNGKRYAEALAILNALHEAHPGNPHVDAARAQCLRALQRSANALQQYGGARVADDRLTPELVKSVVLDKMLHARDEGVQLRAAELAARLLGLLPGGAPAPSAPVAAPGAEGPRDIVLDAPTPAPDAGNAGDTAAPAPPRRAKGGRKAARARRKGASGRNGGA